MILGAEWETAGLRAEDSYSLFLDAYPTRNVHAKCQLEGNSGGLVMSSVSQ